MTTPANEAHEADESERARLLHVAAKLHARARHFTMEALAHAAGVNRATIYRHLGDREAVVAGIAALRGEQPPEVLDVRTRILRAGAEVLRGEGVAKATVARIAEVAGVAPVTVYRIFENHKALLAAIVEATPARRRGRQLVTEASADLRADLLRFTAPMLATAHQNRSAFVNAMHGMEEHPELYGPLLSSDSRTIHRVGGWLRKQVAAGRLPADLDVQRAAGSFVALLLGWGVVLPTLKMARVDDTERIANSIVDLFLDGVRRVDGSELQPPGDRTCRTPPRARTTTRAGSSPSRRSTATRSRASAGRGRTSGR